MMLLIKPCSLVCLFPPSFPFSLAPLVWQLFCGTPCLAPFVNSQSLEFLSLAPTNRLFPFSVALNLFFPLMSSDQQSII